MSTKNFFLRLDHFIQFLNISSVIIGLEFSVSESLLDNHGESALFVFQKNPDLLIF